MCYHHQLSVASQAKDVINACLRTSWGGDPGFRLCMVYLWLCIYFFSIPSCLYHAPFALNTQYLAATKHVGAINGAKPACHQFMQYGRRVGVMLCNDHTARIWGLLLFQFPSCSYHQHLLQSGAPSHCLCLELAYGAACPSCCTARVLDHIMHQESARFILHLPQHRSIFVHGGTSMIDTATLLLSSRPRITNSALISTGQYSNVNSLQAACCSV